MQIAQIDTGGIARGAPVHRYPIFVSCERGAPSCVREDEGRRSAGSRRAMIKIAARRCPRRDRSARDTFDSAVQCELTTAIPCHTIPFHSATVPFDLVPRVISLFFSLLPSPLSDPFLSRSFRTRLPLRGRESFSPSLRLSSCHCTPPSDLYHLDASRRQLIRRDKEHRDRRKKREISFFICTTWVSRSKDKLP